MPQRLPKDPIKHTYRKFAEKPVELTPGSHRSRMNGCECLAVANQYGTGIHGPGVRPQWQVAENCPMHAHLVQPARNGVGGTGL